MLQVSSAFSQLLNLHNLTEEISNAQHERAVRMGEVCTLGGALCACNCKRQPFPLMSYCDGSQEGQLERLSLVELFFPLGFYGCGQPSV